MPNVNDPQPLCPNCRMARTIGRRWQGTVRFRCPKCKAYSVLEVVMEDWVRLMVKMVQRAPMRRAEVAIRLDVSERQVRDQVRSMAGELHEWDGQVYAGQ